MAIPNILSIFPTDGFVGFPVGAEIKILMDAEVDYQSAVDSIMLFGPDFDVHSGPDGSVYSWGHDYENILKSPGYSGEQALDITLVKVDSNGDPVDPQTTTGTGDELQHLIVIKPQRVLAENTQYVLYIASDSDIEGSNGLATRSVFDPLADAGNTGSGIMKSLGIYDGVDDDQIVIEVTEAGTAAEMEFDWWLASNPVFVTSRVGLYGDIELVSGVFIRLFGDSIASFEVGDTFTIDLRSAEFLDNTFKVVFTTATDNVVDLPSTVSTSPIGILPPEIADPSIVGTSSDLVFQVTHINPADCSSHLDTRQNQIVVTFSEEIDPSSVSYSTVDLVVAPVDGSAEGQLANYSYIVLGNKLYITIFK